MTVRPKRRVAIAGLAALLVAVTACGGDDSTGTSDSSGSLSSEQRAEPLGPADPATGEPVRIGMISDGATQAYEVGTCWTVRFARAISSSVCGLCGGGSSARSARS